MNSHDACFAATFSICALDPKTGEAGVAVASACLSVGALVPFAEPGIGAIATQAFVNPFYGPKGLEMLRKGVSAEETIRRLTHEDVTITADEPRFVEFYKTERLTREGEDFIRVPSMKQIHWFTRRIRQVGIVDRHGQAAVHTGPCMPAEVASLAGPGWCCQGNTLASQEVVRLMAEAYEKSRAANKKMLTSLLAALEAGDRAGGDRRGKNSAAVLLVRERGHWSGMDRFCDVRVDEDRDPVAKLIATARKYEEG